MKIDLYKIKHPGIQNRELTVLFVDNKLDIPSLKFLIHEARYGGRHNDIAGRTTHRGVAIKISELYRHLHDIGKTWDNALETDIIAIRNAMLCWDKNDSENIKNFKYDKISHDAMNQKIGIWFKFYNHMTLISVQHTMNMSTKKVAKKTFNKLLGHLDNRLADKNMGYIDIWAIKVKPDPERKMFHALTRTEFEVFDKELNNIDPVFSMISNLMVETGLRISSVKSIKKSEIKKYFVYLNQGKNINETVPLEYINKGGNIKFADLPIRFIAKLQTEYLAREYPKRFKRYKQKYRHDMGNDIVFLLRNGRPVNYNDVLRAFRTVSKKLSYLKSVTPHWMRHTFATWFIIDHVNQKDSRPLSDFTFYHKVLQSRMGHVSENTTNKYLATAMEILSKGVYEGPMMSGLSVHKNKNVQKIITQEARYELGDQFNGDTFDLNEYMRGKNIVIDDE